MLIPDLKQTCFWNGDSPIWNLFWCLPITERGPLFQNGYPILEWFRIGDSFPESTIGNGNYSRTVSDWTVPVLKRGCSHSPFWNRDPYFGMGIANCYVPILKWGFVSQRGVLATPFQNGDHATLLASGYAWLKGQKEGSPHSVMGRRWKNFQIGESHSKKEFVPNRGLTHTQLLSYPIFFTRAKFLPP